MEEEQVMKIYPNPFAERTTIAFKVNEQTAVELTVLDRQGRLIQTLISEAKHAVGTYKMSFDGSDLPEGMYMVRLKIGERQEIQKLILLR